MGAFRTIIGCNFDQYLTGSFEPTRYLVLDTQEEKTVNANAVIATQPLQSGDTMSDHMYREPVKFTINGQFSLNGKNWDDDSYNFMQKGDRLTNIQEVFEYIKDNGILCRLTTIDEEDVIHSNPENGGGLTLKTNARSRFKTRNNMALTQITWTERQNSVKFSFGFNEVIMVESQEYEELSDEERESLGLPYVTAPVGSSLGSVLADTGQLSQTIVQSLYDNGYISNDFLRELCGIVEGWKSMGMAAAVIAVGLTVAAITAIPAAIAVAGAVATGGSVLAALAGSVSAVFPVGTIVVAVAAVIAGIAIGIANLINWRKKQEKQKKAFKLINGSAEQDGERLQMLLEDIEVTINKVKTGLTIYNITGNHRQTVTLNIGGEYYLLEFDKNNATKDESWGCKVTDMAGEALSTMKHNWCPVSSFTDLSRTKNCWFLDKSKQYEVYLVNPSLSSTINKTQQEINAAKAQLEGYSIWVSKGEVQRYIKRVEDAIENAIEKEGFVK